MQNITNELDKKAISNIVVTILIIFLAISSITILAVFLSKYVKENTDYEKSCISMQLKDPIKIESACFNKSSQETKTSLIRNENSPEINFLVFELKKGELINKFVCSSDCKNCAILPKGNSKSYYVDSSEQFEKVHLSIGNCPIAEKEIIPC
ncbi:hypothetical protein J4463_00935 [Candidatus Pacearchaeota archaeon]|nr:hypothetical protein [Candidatus Pacearchaeota archaeon]